MFAYQAGAFNPGGGHQWALCTLNHGQIMMRTVKPFALLKVTVTSVIKSCVPESGKKKKKITG